MKAKIEKKKGKVKYFKDTLYYREQELEKKEVIIKQMS